MKFEEILKEETVPILESYPIAHHIRFVLKKYPQLFKFLDTKCTYAIEVEFLSTGIEVLPWYKSLFRILTRNFPFNVVEKTRKTTLRTFDDKDPKDPFVLNNALECFEYLTKNYD